MSNIRYLLVSLILVWGLLVGYLIYLQFKLDRLEEIVDGLPRRDPED